VRPGKNHLERVAFEGTASDGFAADVSYGMASGAIPPLLNSYSHSRRRSGNNMGIRAAEADRGFGPASDFARGAVGSVQAGAGRRGWGFRGADVRVGGGGSVVGKTGVTVGPDGKI
jgi:hypothetical protein